MTPGVVAAQKAGIKFSIRQYRHDRNAASYGAEAAQKSEVDAATIFKTLVVQADSGELMVTVVPVLGRLDLKSAATALQVKKLKMADKERGNVLPVMCFGGVSPLGQKQAPPTVIDQSAQAQQMMHVSGGRRGLEIALSPTDLAALCNATFADIARSTETAQARVAATGSCSMRM